MKLEQLKQVSPWIVQFTPSADAKALTEPPKRPPSPFSGKPLRAKDLLPVNLVRNSSNMDFTFAMHRDFRTLVSPG